jgi:hypothetical protein
LAVLRPSVSDPKQKYTIDGYLKKGGLTPICIRSHDKRLVQR